MRARARSCVFVCESVEICWYRQGNAKVLRQKPDPLPVSPQIMHMWFNLESNPGLLGERTAVKRLIYSMAISIYKLYLFRAYLFFVQLFILYSMTLLVAQIIWRAMTGWFADPMKGDPRQWIEKGVESRKSDVTTGANGDHRYSIQEFTAKTRQ